MHNKPPMTLNGFVYRIVYTIANNTPDEAAANEPFWTGGEGPRVENQRQRRATAVSPFERRSALIGAELDVGDEEERDGRPCLNLMESAVTTTHRQRRRDVSGGAWARVLQAAKVSDC
ncbi:hypothetical protein LWI28_018156 [Acer negundo]|uniref:Uncharacterized protein n=1 Tax=Acer negundo TaxID=4023 RepID=A0AAD5IMW1_ACENE|nr:hypothetical protein LWI28_018156 [Acer negundo]